MPLKYEIETVFRVEYGDLDEFIALETGNTSGFSVQQDLELGNDSQVRIEVTGELDEWIMKDYADWLLGKNEYGRVTRSILANLCAEGKMPAGVYLVMVCW